MFTAMTTRKIDAVYHLAEPTRLSDGGPPVDRPPGLFDRVEVSAVQQDRQPWSVSARLLVEGRPYARVNDNTDDDFRAADIVAKVVSHFTINNQTTMGACNE